MAKLNHINLAVSNVPELKRFFEIGFGFRLAVERAAGKFSLLLNEDGFVLALIHDKNAGAEPYPKIFHVGFLVDSIEEVHQYHERLTKSGFDAPTPAALQPGVRNAYGFYSKAPGGVLVEVSTSAV